MEVGFRHEAGRDWQITLPGGVAMTFRFIPAGEFRMGQRGERDSEQPVHRVVIPDGFWMGETPVTQEQFKAWKADHENYFPRHNDHPVEQVTWDNARRYCRWLTKQCLSASEWAAQLPDEARWEYACRAGTETEYHSGDGIAALAEVGWYDDNAGETTHPVGAKKRPNNWGLHDMHGNVFEWCADVWDARAYRKRADGWVAHAWTIDDAGADIYWGKESPDRVLRGGSWFYSARICRAAFRYRSRPSSRVRIFGFRVCLARSSPAQERSRNEAEPVPGGERRRQAEAEPDGTGAARRGEIDLTREVLPRERE